MEKIMEEKKSGVKKFSEMSDEELLLIEELDDKLPEIPGLPRDIIICSICGEHGISRNRSRYSPTDVIRG